MPNHDLLLASTSNQKNDAALVTPAVTPAPAPLQREWVPGNAPGFAEELGIKPVPVPAAGTLEYEKCADLIKQMRSAIKRASAAETDERRFQIVGHMAARLTRCLDGRHKGLPLVEGDIDDPLYALVVAARKVQRCLMFGKGKYFVPETAKMNIARLHWDKPMLTDMSDIRQEAHQTFLELTTLIVD